MKYSSVFDVIGPVMIGPSSSHTAGAARIGKAARDFLERNQHTLKYIYMDRLLKHIKGTELTLRWRVVY